MKTDKKVELIAICGGFVLTLIFCVVIFGAIYLMVTGV